jgi:hypothetical protein
MKRKMNAFPRQQIGGMLKPSKQQRLRSLAVYSATRQFQMLSAVAKAPVPIVGFPIRSAIVRIWRRTDCQLAHKQFLSNQRDYGIDSVANRSV